MTTRSSTRLVRAGEYAAEVEVELLDAQGGWAPYLSLENAYKLDDLREALESGDVQRAGQMGRVFRLTPVDASQ